MANVTRRNFLQAAAVAGGMVGLAGCNAGTGTTGSAADPLATPAADKYPIDPDGEKVEAKWSSETSRKDKWTRVTNPDGGATLGVMDTAKIIQVDGYAFKDMNGNGKLDLWEDWRQSPEDRAKALAESMSAEEILPLMWHNGCNSTTAPLSDDDAASLKAGMRAGVSRAQAAPDNYVEAINWINAVQEECEKSAYGIPYLNSTDQYQNFDIPDNDGLVASMDMDIIRRAAKVQAKVWRATGVRCLLGPQIDISTNPTYCRYSGSASEDPALNRDFARAFITGLHPWHGQALLRRRRRGGRPQRPLRRWQVQRLPGRQLQGAPHPVLGRRPQPGLQDGCLRLDHAQLRHRLRREPQVRRQRGRRLLRDAYELPA